MKARGFTLVETLIGLTVVVSLSALSFSVFDRARTAARRAVSTGNLKQLAIANLSYAADHGTYVPAQSPDNLVRWHGGRSSQSGEFDPRAGFLADYLGESRRVGQCPHFANAIDAGSFELGSGGYGYNATYLGGTPEDSFAPEKPFRVRDAGQTLMFATTALSKAEGLQEYPYAEPRQWVTPNRKPGGPLQPSVHFRFNGKALVAWCDGSVTAVTADDYGSSNYYGGDNEEDLVGFFGPTDRNGVWNPLR